MRLYFMYDRRLLVKLSHCAWKVLSLYLKQGMPRLAGRRSPEVHPPMVLKPESFPRIRQAQGFSFGVHYRNSPTGFICFIGNPNNAVKAYKNSLYFFDKIPVDPSRPKKVL